MNFGELVRARWPWTGSGHGPLPVLLLGAVAGGRIAARFGKHRGRQLRAAAAIAVVPVVLATIVAAIAGQPVSDGARYALIAPLGIAMGIQNATARRLAVPT